jgi:hypothetical protein
VDRPVNDIAQRLNATTDQVLLAWVKAKGAVAVTYGNLYFHMPVYRSLSTYSRSSSKKFRMEGYIAAADLSKPVCNRPVSLLTRTFAELTSEDVAAIDIAGAKGARRRTFIKTMRVMAELMLLGAVAFRFYAFFAEYRRRVGESRSL